MARRSGCPADWHGPGSGLRWREIADAYLNRRHTRQGGYPVRRDVSAQVQTPRNTGSSAFADDDDGEWSYFRTQITRTTEALASDEVPAASTPLALRKSCTVSDGTSS